MTRLYSALILILLTAACSGNATRPSTSTNAPTAAPMLTMAYAINIPDATVVARANGEYPNGVLMGPAQAQAQWNYTSAYGGSPNVYYGETSPCHEYPGVGIVVAPYAAASQPTFTAATWPSVAKAGVTYQWVGRFAYAAVAPAGSYQPDTTCGH